MTDTNTGWFELSNDRFVHVVENDLPICGTVLPDGAKFKWMAQGVNPKAIDCPACAQMIATPRKRGAKRRYGPMKLIQMHVEDDLAQWFEGLPGNSNHERMAWLREQIEQFDDERVKLAGYPIRP